MIRQRAHRFQKSPLRNSNSILQIHPNAFHLGIAFERVHAELATVAAHFVSAKSSGGIVIVIRVDPDSAGFETARDAMRFGDIASPNGSSQAVRIFVGLA